MPLDLAVGLTQPVATFVATEVLPGATIPHNGRLLPSPGDSVIICSVGGQVSHPSPSDDAKEQAARAKAGEAFDGLWASGGHHLAIGRVAGCVPVGEDDCTLTFDRVELIPPGDTPSKEPGATEGLFLIVESRS